MGCSIDVYRGRIYLFVSVLHKILTRNTKIAASRVRGFKLTSKLSCLLVASWLMTLLVIGNVERNPGPASPSTATQDNNSREMEDGTANKDFMQSVQAGFQQIANDQQHSFQRLENGQQGLNNRLDTLESTLASRLVQLEAEQDVLRLDLDELTDRQEREEAESSRLREKVEELSTKLDMIDTDRRKCNLMFFGVIRRVGATCEQLIDEVCKDQLQLTDTGVEYARWAGNAILVHFQSMKHRARVLTQTKRLTPDCQLSIREDLPKAVNERHKGLVHLYRQLRQDGKRATLRGDQLYKDDGCLLLRFGTAGDIKGGFTKTTRQQQQTT